MVFCGHMQVSHLWVAFSLQYVFPRLEAKPHLKLQTFMRPSLLKTRQNTRRRHRISCGK